MNLMNSLKKGWQIFMWSVEEPEEKEQLYLLMYLIKTCNNFFHATKDLYNNNKIHHDPMPINLMGSFFIFLK